MNLSITVFDTMRLFISNVSSEEWVSAILYQKKDRLLYAAGDNNLYVPSLLNSLVRYMTIKREIV
jgi:hypothetical protein